MVGPEIYIELWVCVDAGEDVGVVPGRRRAEPPQGVQDAADGRAGPGEAARRRAGAAAHGQGGQGAPHPGARRAEGRPAAGVLQGRARQQRQLIATAVHHGNGTENKTGGVRCWLLSILL
jgi:hypothetical protein